MAIILHPYNRSSAGVGELISAFRKIEGPGVPRCLVKVRTPPTSRKSLIVNWGIRGARYDQAAYPKVLNRYEATRLMTDKLRMFRHVGHDCTLVPEWTDVELKAREWGATTVARYKTAGTGGDGLVLWEPGGDALFPAKAPLYTRYERKTDEFRCHCFRDKQGNVTVRLVQKKGTRLGPDGKALNVGDWRVRNLENGFIFIKNNFETPKEVTDVASAFMRLFPGLDFCALDVIYHSGSKKQGTPPKAFVLEGNTAPGLEGTTVDTYVSYFLERAKE